METQLTGALVLPLHGKGDAAGPGEALDTWPWAEL